MALPNSASDLHLWSKRMLLLTLRQAPSALWQETMVHMLQGGKAGQAEKQDTQTTQKSEEAGAGLSPAAQTGRGNSMHKPSGKQPPVILKTTDDQVPGLFSSSPKLG